MPSAPLQSITPQLVALLAILSLTWLLWRYRPRQTPCPPTCRRCGYDVSQRPADSMRCSECGADLSARKAITTTRRTRPRWYVAAAGLALVGACTWFATQAYRFPWTTWYLFNAPTSRIAAHARGSDAFANRAFDQWILRYQHAALDPPDVSRFHEF